MRYLRLATACLSLALLSLAGCKGNCRTLSEKLCDCELNALAREACLRNAADQDGRVAPTAEQEEVCGELLERCECSTISTPEGKQACGLAR
jgi:hypothetical protein